MFSRFEHNSAKSIVGIGIALAVESAHIVTVNKYLIVLIAAESFGRECKAVTSGCGNFDIEGEVITVICEIAYCFSA